MENGIVITTTTFQKSNTTPTISITQTLTVHTNTIITTANARKNNALIPTITSKPRLEF